MSPELHIQADRKVDYDIYKGEIISSFGMTRVLHDKLKDYEHSTNRSENSYAVPVVNIRSRADGDAYLQPLHHIVAHRPIKNHFLVLEGFELDTS